MKARKMSLAAAAALALGVLTACGGTDPEPQETDAPESAEETPTAEPVEMNPEKMTGELDQEQTQVFTEYALDKVDEDVCNLVHFTLPKEDLTGVVNLILDAVGRDQGVESVSRVGVMRHAQDKCDY